MITVTVTAGGRVTEAWRGFAGARWRTEVDVHDFIQVNLTPHEGDAAFLSGPTDRTLAVRGKTEHVREPCGEQGVLAH